MIANKEIAKKIRKIWRFQKNIVYLQSQKCSLKLENDSQINIRNIRPCRHDSAHGVVNDSQINIRNIVDLPTGNASIVVNDSQINIRNIHSARLAARPAVVNDSQINIRNISCTTVRLESVL